MIQGQGMALESGVPIGLGQVPGIPGLGGKAKIGKSQVVDDLALLPEQSQIALRHVTRVRQDERQKQQATPDKKKESVGFSQGLISIRSGGSS
jgi:hypothetical protein